MSQSLFMEVKQTMPNAKVLEEKKAQVASLVEKIKNSPAGVVVDYKGINVADDTALRKELRENGVEYAVVKNTMLKFAAQEVGFDGMFEHLHGTTALAIASDDVVAPAKILLISQRITKTSTSRPVSSMVLLYRYPRSKSWLSCRASEVLIAQTLYSFNYPIMQLAIALNAIAEKGEADQEALVSTLVGAAEEAPAEEAAE